MQRVPLVLVLAFLLALSSAMATGASDATQDEEPLYECKTDDGYETFEADSDLVNQVCPAYRDNFSKTGMNTSGPLYIVIHNTGNYADNVIKGNIDQFQNPAKGVSSHYIVGFSQDRKDVHVIQLVREAHRAFHVGTPHSLGGVTIDNTNSIGIEVVGQGDLPDWPSDAVYRRTAELVLGIVRRAQSEGRTIELTRKHIVGHEEANKSGKWDPGQRWNWQVFMEDYLGGKYEPAMALNATLVDGMSNVRLELTARDNGRTGLRVERKRGSGQYASILEAIPDTGDGHDPNPATIKITEQDTLPPSAVPAEYCYRVWGFKPHTLEPYPKVDYVNPSTEACVELGLADADVIRQTEDVVVKPGAPFAFTVALKNVGDLTWRPEGKYGLFKFRGEHDGLPWWITFENTVPPGQTIELNFTGTAPSSIQQYLTAWRIVYVNPDTGKAEAFGPIITFGVTVFPIGDIPDDPGDVLRLLWEKLSRAVEEWVGRWLADLAARLGDALRDALYSLFPWLRCLSGLSLGMVVPIGLAVRRRRNRRQ